jgi:ankyrin repeat protein
LVTIVKDGDSRVVQFSHFSVKEFLTADWLAEPMRDVSSYHIRLKAAHTIHAQACLGVLLLFLLSHGADIDARNRFNDTALIYAMVWGSVEFVRMLLERGAVIDARGTFGGTALHHAAIHNSRVQFARPLLEHGADVNARDKEGNTPAQVGPSYGYLSMLPSL